VRRDGGAFRILVIEDEESYRDALSSGLTRQGYEVATASDGPGGLRLFHADPPDLVLLDLLLPGMRGTDVCRRIRQTSRVPVIMVSAIDSEVDVVLGLELGATDYVTKPFHLRELVARIEAVLRRVPAVTSVTSAPASTTSTPGGPVASATPAPPTPEGLLAFGDVVVDFNRRAVTRHGTDLHLSRREFDLLAALSSPPGRVHTREDLLDLLWPGGNLVDSRTLDTHVHRLRSKIEMNPSAPRHLMTVRGVGFRLDVDTARPPLRGVDDALRPPAPPR
jgi:two-component system response regulator RegX3